MQSANFKSILVAVISFDEKSSINKESPSRQVSHSHPITQFNTLMKNSSLDNLAITTEKKVVK